MFRSRLVWRLPVLNIDVCRCTLNPGRYFGGKDVVQDAQGKLTLNPYVYLYLGPCSGAQRQQQVRKGCAAALGSAAWMQGAALCWLWV